MEENFEQLFSDIKKRYYELQNQCDRESLVNNLRSLSLWNNEPMDYPDKTGVTFPSSIHIAHAVCHPKCGAEEFIVDGSTQKCQHCGGLMFRGEVKEYKLNE